MAAPIYFLSNLVLSLLHYIFFAYLRTLKAGCIIFKTPREEIIIGDEKERKLRVTVTVNREVSFYWKVITGWDLGFAEAYMAEDIDVDDLTKFFEVMMANRQVADTNAITSALTRWFGRLVYVLTRTNTVKNARKNIHDHYDLSNDMFMKFLDPTMMYSCAYFKRPDETLEEAQRNKIHKMIEKVRITPCIKLILKLQALFWQ
jgi:cyclopropane-fatty-acyl-phospholipid synthase